MRASTLDQDLSIQPAALKGAGSAAGKAFLDMPGVFAGFETNLRRGRQREGIRAAKARGVSKGRKPSVGRAEVRRPRLEENLGPYSA